MPGVDAIQEYLAAVEDQIRWKRARPVVSLELRRHLEDQRDAFAAEGLEDAERLAVEEMGDPVAIGTELDRLHRPQPQWGFLALTLALALAGAFLRVWFSRELGPYAASQFKTAGALVLGTAALLGMYFLDISFMARHPRAVYAGALAAGALSLWLSPRANMGSYYTRYIVLLYPAVYAVWLYSCRGSTWRRFFLAIAGGIPLAAVCVLVPYMFGAYLLLFSGLVVLLCAIRQGWFGSGRGKAVLVLLSLAAVVLWILLGSDYGQYIAMRLRIAFHPEMEPKGKGYYGWFAKMFLQDVPLIRGRNASAAASAGIRGRVFGSDGSSVDIIADQDFLPLKLLVGWGWLAYLMLMAALAFLLVWLLARCLRQRQQLGRMIALAVVLTLGTETLFNTALNLGFALFSSRLPLVTGNLGTVVDMALIGMALSVFRGGSLIRNEPQEKKSGIPWRAKISTIFTKEESRFCLTFQIWKIDETKQGR